MKYNKQLAINNKPAFTLIELLIVIAIIGLLSAFGAFTFTSAQAKARDSQRKNDLNQIKKALILARNDCKGGYYPKGTTVTTNPSTEKDSYTNELLPILTTTSDKDIKYLANVNLNDPLFNSNPTTYHYAFRADLNTATGNVCPDPSTQLLNYAGTYVFVLRAKLEQGTNDPDANKSYTNCETIINSVTWTETAPSSTDGYYYVCGN